MGRHAVRIGCLAAAVAVAVAGWPAAGRAGAAFAVGEFEVIRFVPDRESAVEFSGRRYRGVIEVRSNAEGLVVVEHTDVDGYLEGIAEVPFSWPEEALAAQAVAARTYLAYTLSRGRSSTGTRNGFDICASSACQVYAGVGLVEGFRGDRWAAAVRGTADEILVYDDRPAETYYHSTSGGRTEAVQDVWRGATPLPYLQGVDSPDERSPFVDWLVVVPTDAFLTVLAESGLGVGDRLLSFDIVPSEKGSGVWRARILGSGGLQIVDVSRIRSAMNIHGDDLFPEVLPALRSNGRRYPQPILSYRFDVAVVSPLAAMAASGAHSYLPSADLPPASVVVFDGSGWGHHIGMSQYGARAMAESGASYREILAHYYGGLEPVASPGVLPETVAVGLAWGRDSVEINLNGAVDIEADGVVVVESATGPWSMIPDDGGTDRLRLRSGQIGIESPRRRFISI